MSSLAPRRIGLLTGTFDPVHLGHAAMARAAMGACGLEEVWWLVNPEPGHKTGVASLDDRLAMVRLAVLGQPGMRVGKVLPHRMAEFERLMGNYPETEFVFVVGADVLGAMRAWEDYEPAVARGRFAVAQRSGVNEELDSRLRAESFVLGEHGAASSRVIKDELVGGGRPVELDERVYEYIRDRGLYGISG